MSFPKRPVAFCVILVICMTCPALGAEPGWILLDQNEFSSFSLEPSAGKPQGKPIQVSVRVAYSEKGRRDAIETLKGGKTLEGLAESRYFYQVDCSGNKSKLQRVKHMDAKGQLLKSSELEQVTSWEEIPAGARLSLVAEKVCGGKGR